MKFFRRFTSGLGGRLRPGTAGEATISKKKFRSFKEARNFVHALKLKSGKEWRQYCRGELEGLGPKPPKPGDIPVNPNQTYKNQGWQGMGDWLGTGTIATFNREYRSFEEARNFVHALKLKSGKEWRQYCRGVFGGKMPKPEDIPANPDKTYKAQGWQDWGNWLGTGRIAVIKREYRPFKKAREFVHALKLESYKAWRQYCKGELGGKMPKPEDIPADPRHIYKAQGWQNWGDWLGTGTSATRDRIFRPFKEARKFVHALKLKNGTEWRYYCKGGFEGRILKPEDIPSAPWQTYKAQGWQGMGDWLGTGTIATFKREYRPYKEAREFVRALKLANQREWGQYCRGELEGRMPKPEDIPADPRYAYKAKGWQGMGDWLGTGTV